MGRQRPTLPGDKADRPAPPTLPLEKPPGQPAVPRAVEPVGRSRAAPCRAGGGLG